MYTSAADFYSTMGINTVQADMLMNCLPTWLFGPLGYALFAFIVVLIKYRRPIAAFFAGGAKAARRELEGKKSKKGKDKKRKRKKSYCSY